MTRLTTDGFRSHLLFALAKKMCLVMVALSLLSAACGESEGDGDAGSLTSATAGDTTPATTDAPAATTTEAPPESTTEAPTTLPGEPIDIGPRNGDTVAVVGVAFDDTLNARQGPGTDFEIVTELAPDTDNIVTTGHNRLLPNSIWFEIQTEAGLAWVSGSFIGFLGVTETGDSDLLPIELIDPLDETIEEVGQFIAEQFASEDPQSSIVQVTEPDGGIITFDVIGLGDDALLGYRVTTVAVLDGSVPRAISEIRLGSICGRGLADGGLCT